ncbi:MAG: DUF3618 domain-containing protein [Sphingomonas bacterium]|nr:DUF3618 domain-containing protein [Sphingomonas bacterium]
MTEAPKVVAARIEVAKRRAALIDTAKELQVRLAPKTLASEAWEKAKNKGADIAEDAVDAVRSRPVAVGGVAAALAMFFARDPLKDAAVKLYDAMTSKPAAKKQAPALKANKPNKSASRPAKPRARRAPRITRKTETVT